MTSPIRPKGANSGLDLQGCRGLIFSDETRIRYCIYSRADLLTYFLGASGRRQREQGATNFGLDYWDVGAFLFLLRSALLWKSAKHSANCDCLPLLRLLFEVVKFRRCVCERKRNQLVSTAHKNPPVDNPRMWPHARP